MKKALIILLLTAFGLSAQATGSSGARSPSKTAKKTTAVQPVTIPADAIATPNGSYSWTDKQGKRWIFAKTPFGIMKSEALPAPGETTSMPGVKTFDAGDKVRFETTTPFGVIKREKNKADLTDDERNLFNSQNPTQNEKQD